MEASPLYLCTRVTLTDRETGRMAFLWETEGKSVEYIVNECTDQYMGLGAYTILMADCVQLHTGMSMLHFLHLLRLES